MTSLSKLFSLHQQVAFALSIGLCGTAIAQVADYSFTSSQGTWAPLQGGSYVGYDLIDDAAFVDPADLIGFNNANFGPGFPIGFDFTFNGITFDRYAISPEGWISLGQSSRGGQAVYLPLTGNEAYAPLATPAIPTLDPVLHHRIVAFAADLKAQTGGPMTIQTTGIAPNRTCVVQWNNMGMQMAGSSLNFQIRLNEGGGVPSAQTVQVVYGTMSPGVAPAALQVGLGGSTVADFNARSVPSTPFNWTSSTAATTNTATCGFSTGNTTLPSGLTYTWTPSACTVTDVAFTDLAVSGALASGTLSWSPVTGASTYDCVITSGSPSDPALASATGIIGTSVALTDIPADSVFFVYVRANCSGTAGGWGAGISLDPGSVIAVPCGDPPVHQTLCYVNNEQYSWHYTSNSGAALRAEFAAGYLDSGDHFKIYDGPTSASPLIFTGGTGDALAGQQVSSSGSDLYMTLATDGSGSCPDQPWYTPWDWHVGCLDCNPILAGFQMTQDCDAGTFSVQVTVASLGSASSALITSNGAAPPVAVSGPGVYAAGPFPLDTPVTVTVENPDNAFCSSISPPFVNAPCATIGCGPTDYTNCYADNEHGAWLYQADGNELMGIRFRQGGLSYGDNITITNGADPFSDPPLYTAGTFADLANVLNTTTASNTAHAILLEVLADNYSSCADSGYGAVEWQYVVACYDGCTQPQAGFTVVNNCDSKQFSVAVAITDIGSAGSVSITNDGGATAVAATAVGTYTVGPFPVGAHVRLEVEGASALCSWTSPVLTDGCDDIGIAELQAMQLGIYPNPNEGAFKIVPPTHMRGVVSLHILDVSGRSVFTEEYNHQGEDHIVHLTALTSGAYAVILSNNGTRATGQLRIVR